METIVHIPVPRKSKPTSAISSSAELSARGGGGIAKGNGTARRCKTIHCLFACFSLYNLPAIYCQMFTGFLFVVLSFYPAAAAAAAALTSLVNTDVCIGR